MSTISLYPKTWALYQQGRLPITEPHGLVLVSASYVYDATHRDYGDIPAEAIIAECNLDTIRYESADNRYAVSDVTFLAVSPDIEAVGIILYKQERYTDESRLVWFSTDLAGLPLTTSGNTIQVSFPSGILGIDPTGYSAPDMVLQETETVGAFHASINEDIANNIMNLDEFGIPITYYHSQNSIYVNYVVIETTTPDEITVGDVDQTSITKTLKIQNTDLRHMPRMGDEITINTNKYTVAAFLAETYTSDLYLQNTVGP